jgi:hypothetical protein
VCQPGDGVGLARPGGVLHQVVLSCAPGLGVRLQLEDGVPLVQAGEDDLLVGSPGRHRALGGPLDVDEAGQKVHPGVPGPDSLPQVRGPVPVGVGRVALAAVVPEVEGQELGRLPGELGGHGHAVRVDGEVDQGSAGQGDVGRVPVDAVLGLGVLDGLVGERVLEFGGGGRDAVYQQGQVDGLGGVRLVGELAGDGDPVGVVEGGEGLGEAVSGPEVGEMEGDPEVHHSVSQHVDRAPLVEFGGEPLGERTLGRVDVVVETDQSFPLLGLSHLDEGEEFSRVEAEGGVEVGRDGLQVAAVVEEVGLDGILEVAFARSGHAATPGMSSSPVTAAVTRA